MGKKIVDLSNIHSGIIVSLVFGCISSFLLMTIGALTFVHSFHTVKHHEVERLDNGVYRNYITIKANINEDVKIDTLDTVTKKVYLAGETYVKYDNRYYSLIFFTIISLLMDIIVFIACLNYKLQKNNWT